MTPWNCPICLSRVICFPRLCPPSHPGIFGDTSLIFCHSMFLFKYSNNNNGDAWYPTTIPTSTWRILNMDMRKDNHLRSNTVLTETQMHSLEWIPYTYWAGMVRYAHQYCIIELWRVEIRNRYFISAVTSWVTRKTYVCWLYFSVLLGFGFRERSVVSWMHVCVV